MSDLRVTTVEELKQYALGDLVPLPPFSENCPFVARLSRPSLLELIKYGKIPNELVSFANKLFYNSTVTEKEDLSDINLLPQMYDVLLPIAKASLVSPKYDDLVNAGIKLTDEQLLFIFNYSQKGVAALKPFPSKGGRDRVLQHGKRV